MASDARLPIHFFTIVLNGEPFIRYHIEQFKKLDCPWHWHIIEGLADLKHDTAWSLAFGAQLPADVVKEGRSIDGTAEYLDQLARDFPDNVTLYRAPNGRIWDGKLEMIAAPMAHLPDECLLVQVDSDELWTTDQLRHLRALFLQYPERTAAIFYCWYFVGPSLVINRRRRFQEIEWRRAWRYRAGMRWVAHEPPVLASPGANAGQFLDVAMINPFLPSETETQGLVFQHFAYTTPEQLLFKEKYYGYKGITDQWRTMQTLPKYPVPLKTYFNWPWVSPQAQVEPAADCGIAPLAHIHDGKWMFENSPQPLAIHSHPTGNSKRGILYVKWGPNTAVLERAIRSVQTHHPELPIHVHQLPDNATLLDKATLFDVSPFEETLFLDVDTIVLDRLDFGFDMAIRHGLACSICENPWARRYGGIKGDLVEYNTGVFFFTRAAQPIFEAWKKYVRAVDSSIRFYNQQNQLTVMPYNDQAGFALAVAEAEKLPFVLPYNWNFRPAWHRAWWGPIKIWHDYTAPPPEVINLVKEQADPNSIIRFVKFTN